MVFDYEGYIKQYNKEKLVAINIRLHVEHDKDLIKAFENIATSKQARAKDLLRKGLKLEGGK